MNVLKQISLLALAGCLGLGLVGCQPSDPSPPAIAFVTTVAVTPNPVNLQIGGVQALSVTGSFSDGTSHIVTFDSTFASSAPAIARVDAATGYVTALAAGTATIAATHRPSGKLASTTVTVAPLQVMSIAVAPATASMAVGAKQALTVTATYNNATTGPVTAGSTFASSNPAVATVDAAGVVSGVAVGTATVTATHTASGKTSSAAITVATASSGSFTKITFDDPAVTYTLTGFGGFTATATRMTVRVYSPKAGIPVRLKVEDAADPTRSVETEALTTVANAWETLTFDFSKQAAGIHVQQGVDLLQLRHQRPGGRRRHVLLRRPGVRRLVRSMQW